MPGQLAGVVGPCPSCQTLIQAPHPAAQAHYEAHPQSAYHSPTAPTAQETTPAAESAQPAVLRPEPRQLPNRAEPIEAPSRVRSEPSGARPVLGSSGPPPTRQHRSRIVRFLVPMAFLGLAFGVIYGVKTFLQKDLRQEEPTTTETAGNGKAPSKVLAILPPEEDTFEDLTSGKGGESVAVADPLMPQIGDASGEPPSELQPVDGGIEALKLLEDFLAMKTLEERLPYMESKRAEIDIASSVLNGPLPEVLKISVDVRETNAIEQVIDYYYHVDFADAEGGINPQTMLVRTRGGGAPKVVVDPFIDLFGGRFARYAERPVEEADSFQIIISAGAFCYDDVPAPDKKYTLKILSREDTKEIAKAYFGKRSKIGEMLKDETSGFAYGQAKPSTVFMRWNMDEDPEKPFLEALDIKALNWNP